MTDIFYSVECHLSLVKGSLNLWHRNCFIVVASLCEALVNR